MADEITLIPWLHPSMQIPFKFDAEPMKMSGSKSIVDLMDDMEDMFVQASEKLDTPFDLQINVIWNTKDHKKALNPRDKIGTHFQEGDKFGVYGDIFPLAPQEKTIPEGDKTPVTILTGFLGAGKTTLLNYILQEQREKKIAVIENEFGEISIDDALLGQDKIGMAEKIVVMDNGCMCCTIRGDLAKGLQEIMDEMNNGSGIDAIIIETTGMADPVPIVRTFMADPNLTRTLRLDGVVAVADAKNLPGRLDDKIEEGKVNEAYQQVAFADKIILNKLDLITTEEAIACKDKIRVINKYAKILGAVKGRVKIDELSNIRAHDMANFINEEGFGEVAAEELSVHGGHGDDGHAEGHGSDENCTDDHGGGHGDGGHGGHEGHEGHSDGHSGHGGHGGHSDGHSGHGGHGGGHAHGNGENVHDTRVNSFSIMREGEIAPQRLARWMQSLGQLRPEHGTIFRIKAILAVKGHPFKHVFHAVMDVSDEDDAGPWAEGEKRVSKIVFIGKSMDQKFLRAGWEKMFEDALASRTSL